MGTNRNHQTVERFVVGRHDVGDLGVVDGGRLLGWLTEAGEATAMLWSGYGCVVRSIGAFHLDRPISVGERVLLQAGLVYTRDSEMHIVVTVRTQRSEDPGDTQIAQCSVVYAAVDRSGRDVVVPMWTPLTMLELQRHHQARLRAQTATRIERMMAAQSYTSEGTAPQRDSNVRAVAADGAARGTVQNRRVLRWVDDAACGLAADWAGDRVLTSYLAGLVFYRTIDLDDVVTLSTRILHTGPRSVHVAIRVIAGGTRRELVARAVVVVVVPDERGDARPVPPWRAGSAEDRRLDRHARELLEIRQYIEPGSTALVIDPHAHPVRLHELSA